MQSCYYNGMCYGDSGNHVCLTHNDGHNRRCAPESGLWDWRDRDQSQAYATVTTSTCDALPWFVGAHCEAGLFTNSTSNRCDTYANDITTGYACGDDPNEYPVSYRQYDGFTNNYVDRWACLYSETGCWSLNADDNFRRYNNPQDGSGQEVCSRENFNDVNCDGRLPLYDPQCFVDITGTVQVQRSDGTLQAAYYADVWVDTIRGLFETTASGRRVRAHRNAVSLAHTRPLHGVCVRVLDVGGYR
jgi:hypothetical protein